MLLPSTAARCQTAPATEGRLLFELKGQITPFGEIEYVTQRGVKNAFAICCHYLTVDESVIPVVCECVCVRAYAACARARPCVCVFVSLCLCLCM